MPDNQHPGGVAGRVITHMRMERDSWAQGSHGHTVRYWTMAGGVKLHRELSREAREILGEWQARYPEGGYNDELKRAFQRLGLDLEESDE